MKLINEELTRDIIGAALEVHKHWGPGLLEEIYERSLGRELNLREIPFERQVRIPVLYKNENVGDNLRIDLIVARQVVVEIKAVEALNPIHSAQLLTYLKLTGMRVGLLINFNEVLLKRGVRRMVL
jgi:GxxExxY protein